MRTMRLPASQIAALLPFRISRAYKQLPALPQRFDPSG